MYTLQDFLNTLTHAGSLIYITNNGNYLYKGKHIEILEIDDFEKYYGYHVWRIDIYEDKYLWVNISK